jgi:hypothetical protein
LSHCLILQRNLLNVGESIILNAIVYNNFWENNLVYKTKYVRLSQVKKKTRKKRQSKHWLRLTAKNNTNIENIRWDEIVDFIDGDSFYGITMSYKYINRSKPNVHPDTIYMLNYIA